jgi:hypothetical protein
MQDIDFLPQRYREAHAKRSRKLWGVVVVILYAGLLCTSGYLQKVRQRRLEQELQAANEQRAVVTAQAARLASIQAELKQADARANLILYLRHPWPRTQIVAAVVRPLVPGLSLDELRIQRLDAGPTAKPLARPRAAVANPAGINKADNRTPAQRDLDRLREACDDRSVVVMLKGTAEEVGMVHEYLGHVGKDTMFSRVDLVSIDGQDSQRQGTKGCRFTARLEVRPGYGQPQGPSREMSNAEIRMSKETRMPKSKVPHWAVELFGPSSFFRHSDFDIRHSDPPVARSTEDES